MKVEIMWENYLKSIGESVATTEKTYDSWHFCDNEKDANHLAQLTKMGVKKATTSLVKLYALEQEPIPKEKELHIITDFYGNAVCIIEAKKVEKIPFNQVSEEHAKIEGEGDGSLSYWRDVHAKIYIEDAKTFNFEFSEDDLVFFMIFDVIYQ